MKAGAISEAGSDSSHCLVCEMESEPPSGAEAEPLVPLNALREKGERTGKKSKLKLKLPRSGHYPESEAQPESLIE